MLAGVRDWDLGDARRALHDRLEALRLLEMVLGAAGWRGWFHHRVRAERRAVRRLRRRVRDLERTLR
jgi:hypothetical protein